MIQTIGKIIRTMHFFFLRFNSFELPLRSKSSLFPERSSCQALKQFLMQRSQLNLREVKCLSQDWRATAIRAMGSDDEDRSHSKTIASQERNLGHGMLRPPHSRTYTHYGGNKQKDIVSSNVLGLLVYQHGTIFRFFQNRVKPRAFLDITGLL